MPALLIDWQILTTDGRHDLPVDEKSWHVLTLNEERKICACLRLHQEASSSFEELPVSQSAFTYSAAWGGKLRSAVESVVAKARVANISFGDVGGWAIAAECRHTMEPIRTILAAYGLAQHLGGFLGIATATCKHGSAPMLRKLGLRSLYAGDETIPAYYDDHYNSEMEVLQFDSRGPEPKYRSWIGELRALLSVSPVICARQSLNRVAPLESVSESWDGIPFPCLLDSVLAPFAAA